MNKAKIRMYIINMLEKGLMVKIGGITVINPGSMRITGHEDLDDIFELLESKDYVFRLLSPVNKSKR